MKCEHCNQEKMLQDFPKRRAKNSPIKGTVCRTCSKKITKRNYYDRNKDICKQRAKEHRERDPESYKQYLREYYEDNKETLREKSKEYQKRNREAFNERYRRYHKENPLKAKARSAVRSALRNRTLTRPKVCSSCGSESFVEAHHSDYDKPLNISWLCKPCHWKEHSKH